MWFAAEGSIRGVSVRPLFPCDLISPPLLQVFRGYFGDREGRAANGKGTGRCLESRDVREHSSEAVPAQLPCSACSWALQEDPAGALPNLLPCWGETPLHPSSSCSPLHPELGILVPHERNLGAQTRGKLQCSPAGNLSSMPVCWEQSTISKLPRVWRWGGCP